MTITPKIGFEAEYIHVGLNTDDLTAPQTLLECSIPNCWVESLTMFDHPDFEKDAWYLCHDSSINEEFGAGVEIVSPPMHPDELRLRIPQICKHIRDYGITDESCGFHFTVSCLGLDKIDPLKLLFLMDEEALVDVWGRGNNSYAVPHLEVLESVLRTNLLYTDFNRFLEHGEKELIFNKRSTVNLEKWIKKGLLEFRVAGGPHYEHRELELMKTVYVCLDSIRMCIDGAGEELFLERVRAFYDKHTAVRHPAARFREPRNHTSKQR